MHPGGGQLNYWLIKPEQGTNKGGKDIPFEYVWPHKHKVGHSRGRRVYGGGPQNEGEKNWHSLSPKSLNFSINFFAPNVAAEKAITAAMFLNTLTSSGVPPNMFYCHQFLRGSLSVTRRGGKWKIQIDLQLISCGTDHSYIKIQLADIFPFSFVNIMASFGEWGVCLCVPKSRCKYVQMDLCLWRFPMNASKYSLLR